MNASIATTVGQILQWISKQVIDATASWIKFEDTAVKALRSTGYSGEQLRSINKRLIIETKELAHQYGVTFQELVQFQKKFTEITKSSAILSSQSKEDFTALTRLLGDSAPFEWAEAMQKFGMSAQSSNAWLSKGRIEAKSLGLNAEMFAKEMAKAASSQNRFNFRNGIQGLEKMTGLAMRLGTSIETLGKHIDIDSGAFSDIEKSIETSANLQRLGGSFGAAFSNPMEVMAEGMFDAESAMERLAKAFEGKGTFNRETGQVDMGWYDKKSIGVAAQALGISLDEARTMANRQVMGGAIEQDLKKSGKYGNFSQENIDAIKNLAQYNADKGTFEITYHDSYGKEKTSELKDLTPEALDKIVGLKENEKNIDTNVATIAGQVRLIADTMRGEAKNATSFKEGMEGSQSSAEATGVDWLAPDTWMSKIKGMFQGMPGEGHWITDKLFKLGLGRANGGIIESTPTGIDGVQKFANGGVVDAIANKAIKSDGFSAGEIVKPLAEPHDSGGFVGGSSWYGDKVLTRLNSGEMVLNKAQQARLYAMANSGGSHASGDITRTIAQTNVISKMGNDIGKFVQSSSNVFGKISDGISSANNIRKGRQISKIAASAGRAKLLSPLSLFNNNDYGVRVARMMVRKKIPELANLHEVLSTGATKGVSFVSSKAKALGSGSKKIVSNAFNKAMHSTKIGRALQVDAVLAKNYVQQSKLYEKLGSSINKFSSATKTFGGNVGKFGSKVGVSAVKLGGKAAQGGLKLAGKGISRVSKLATKADSTILKGTTKLLGKRAGNLVKGAGPLGVAISAGIGLMEAGSAISDFQDIKNNINSRDDLTNREKKQLVRQAEDNRNEKVGGAVGSVAGGAVGAALGSVIPVFGTTLGAMAGSFIGEKIGGFIGKSTNVIKETLFGKKADISEEDQAQLDYEESKFGATDLEDPQLMEKAALATIASHDLMISIWNHMNGKEFNGEEKSRGLFGSMADGAKGLIQGAVGVASTLITGPIGLVASAIKNKKKKKDEANKKDAESKEKKEGVEKISETVDKINANIEALLGNYGSSEKKAIEGDEETKKVDKSSKSKLGAIIGGIAGAAFGPLGVIAGSALGKFVSSKVSNESILPKPLGEDAVEVSNTGNTDSTVTNTVSSVDTIKLEVNGTIKLDAGSAQKDIDMNALLDKPEIKEKLMDIVWRGLEYRGGMGRMNMNTMRNVLKGRTI